MNWFYALNGQQAGPVDDAELDRLVEAGTIEPSTLVWYSGLAQWQPYAEARRVAAPAPAVAGEGQAQCSQCGQVLPADEVVRVDNLNVCVMCKPLLLQRLREGVSVQSVLANAPVYAGFWIRLGAAILDGVILIPAYIVMYIAIWFLTDLHKLDFTHFQPDEVARSTHGVVPISLVTQALLGCYSAFCINRFGGTPGKRICKLRVVHGNARDRVTFARGLGRFAAKTIPRSIPSLVLAGHVQPQVIYGIIFVIQIVDTMFIVFDARKRAVHDMVCDTRVLSEDGRR